MSSIRSRNLHPRGSDDVEGTSQVGDEADNLPEALLPDAPGAVDEEHHIGLGAFTHWRPRRDAQTRRP